MSDTNLILAAEKYAENYHDEDKTDVLNAFYHGAEFQRKNQGDTLTVSKLRPMSEAVDNDVVLAYDKHDNEFYKIPVCKLAGWHALFAGWIPLPIYKPEK
jgi:hypothetical protein